MTQLEITEQHTLNHDYLNGTRIGEASNPGPRRAYDPDDDPSNNRTDTKMPMETINLVWRCNETAKLKAVSTWDHNSQTHKKYGRLRLARKTKPGDKDLNVTLGMLL